MHLGSWWTRGTRVLLFGGDGGVGLLLPPGPDSPLLAWKDAGACRGAPGGWVQGAQSPWRHGTDPPQALHGDCSRGVSFCLAGHLVEPSLLSVPQGGDLG